MQSTLETLFVTHAYYNISSVAVVNERNKKIFGIPQYTMWSEQQLALIFSAITSKVHPKVSAMDFTSPKTECKFLAKKRGLFPLAHPYVQCMAVHPRDLNLLKAKKNLRSVDLQKCPVEMTKTSHCIF